MTRAMPAGREIAARDRSAALLVRVWTEGGGATFRARLTACDTSGVDPLGEQVEVAVVATSGELLAVVRAWVQHLESDA